MKIFKLIPISLTLFSFTVFSQPKTNVDVFWAALNTDAPTLNKVIDFNDNQLIILTGNYKVNKSIYTIEIQNTDFEPLKSATFEIPNDRRTYFFDLLKVGNELILFTTKISKGTRAIQAQRLDSKSLELSKEKVELAKVNFKGKPSIYTKEFKIESSPDNKTFFLYSTPYNDELAKNATTVSVIDNSLKPLWTSTIKKSKESGQVAYVDGLMSNKKEVFIYAIEFVKKKEKVNKSDPDKVYALYAFKENGNTFKEYKVEQTNKKFTTAKLYMDTTSGNLVLGSIYIDTEAENEKGIFLASINSKSDQTIFSQFHPFDLDYIKEGLKDWEKKEVDKNRDKDRTEYGIKEIASTSDNGYLVTAEYLKMDSYSSESAFPKYEYFHNDILAIKINSKGSKMWNKKIIKRQHTFNEGKNFASYSFFQNKNRYHFIYNEMSNAEKETNIETGEISTFSLSGDVFNTVMLTINEKGELTKEVLFNTYEMGAKLTPVYSDKTWKGELLIYGTEGNTSIFGTLSF